jgi:hypothetical protein|tara:strand:+ start:745 stop:909 length:165 start_codon:yes stop_codon:yes gene_type:complete
MASPEVTTPPPLLTYNTIGVSGSTASKNNIFPTSECADLSSTRPLRKMRRWPIS